MKTCPVCQAVAFDDAETCFGCLHRFGDDASTDDVPQPMLADDLPPAFLIRLVPAAAPSGAITWTCTVDVAAC